MGTFFKAKSTFLFVLTSFAVLILIECDDIPVFHCPKSGAADPLPEFPTAFSSDVRLNFANQQKTVELRHYKDEVGKRESIEIFAQGRHVKYIVHGEQQLLITFPNDDFASCTLKPSSTIQLEEADSGPNGIIQKVLDASQKVKEFFLADLGIHMGVALKRWEGCFKNPSINVSFSFTGEEWNNPGNGTKSKKLPVSVEAAMDKDFVVGLIDNFQASMPDDIYFQPPEDVYCAGFRADQIPPTIPDFFSYDGEMILSDRKSKFAPFVSHRSVYYDYPSRLSRVDYHDPQTTMEDKEDSKLVAKGISVIHDFNSKVQYMFDIPTWTCEVEDFETTVEVVEEKQTKDTSMITAKQYFALDAEKISYNGQFMTRGYMADVYTAVVSHFDGSAGKSVYSWYFSSVQTKIAEKDKVEKNVLLRMVVHPEAGTQRSDKIEMNIYNFEKEEPHANIYDISSCYNEKLSKFYVITFPANNDLRGSETFLKLAVHIALQEKTGVSKQRIFVSGVNFNKDYMFAEFRLLEAPSSLKKTKTTSKEISLAAAADKLKSSIADGSFKLTVTSDKTIITLIPLKNGFNEFSGDRKEKDPNSFGQGSVIGLTIGMLLLGFVLGGVALNLVVSRKFGVSLLQGKKSGMDNFNNPLNESNM